MNTVMMLVRIARDYAREARKCKRESNCNDLYRYAKQYMRMARAAKLERGL